MKKKIKKEWKKGLSVSKAMKKALLPVTIKPSKHFAQFFKALKLKEIPPKELLMKKPFSV